MNNLNTITVDVSILNENNNLMLWVLSIAMSEYLCVIYITLAIIYNLFSTYYNRHAIAPLVPTLGAWHLANGYSGPRFKGEVFRNQLTFFIQLM